MAPLTGWARLQTASSTNVTLVLKLGRRSRVIAPASVLLAGVLAGCQQPTPAVTLQSGGISVRSTATAYVRNGRQVASTERVTVLRARAGATVGIDVDHGLADKGWSVHITPRTTNATTLDSPSLKGQHHFSFQVGSVTTQVVISEVGAGTTPQGLWVFAVSPTLQ